MKKIAIFCALLMSVVYNAGAATARNPRGTVAAAGAAIAGIGLLGNAGSGDANGADTSGQLQLAGSKSLNQWNYKETITTTFDWETLVCHKCTRTQQCSKTKNPLFGNKYCKTWADPVETCNDIQF